jgi:hypothetical protein
MLGFLAKANKAWVAAAVSFAALTAAAFFGISLSDTMQAGIISAVTGILTWLVPNYS